MLDVERSDGDIAEEVGFIFQLFEDQLRNATADLLGFAENIAEVFIQVVQGLRVTINGQFGFIEKVKTAQFINSMNMVGVVMGEKDCIDFPDSLEQALLPKVRRGIDQNGMTVLPDQNRRAQTLVAWIF